MLRKRARDLAEKVDICARAPLDRKARRVCARSDRAKRSRADLRHCRRERRQIADRNEQAETIMLEEMGHADAAIRRDDRQARSHGFQDDSGNALIIGRKNEDIAASEGVGDG